MKREIDDSIIIGYINNTITQIEREMVEGWIMKSPENRRYFIEIDSSNDAMKVDANLCSVIDVEKGYQKVIKAQNKPTPYYRSLLIVWQKVAAVLIIPLIVVFSLYLNSEREDVSLNSSESSNITWQEIVSPNGSRVNIDLPDGTRVVLNANSKLRFPVVFALDNREVELDGEAYFDVVSNKTNPFKVKCARETIIATGTAFNVEAYEWDTLSMVILERGVVDVNYNGGNQAIKLMPNERLTRNYKSGVIRKENVDAMQLTAWRDGKLIFRNEKLSEIMRKIGMIYNSDIMFQDKEIMDHIYHATFEDESLREILRLMKMSMPIDFIDIDRKKQPNGDYTRHKIIVKNR